MIWLSEMPSGVFAGNVISLRVEPRWTVDTLFDKAIRYYEQGLHRSSFRGKRAIVQPGIGPGVLLGVVWLYRSDLKCGRLRPKHRRSSSSNKKHGHGHSHGKSPP